jgi:hypothetical protein
MITPPATSPKGVLHCPTVLLLSKTLPELISLISFTTLGVIVLPKIIIKFFFQKNVTKIAQKKIPLDERHSCPESR